MANVKRGATLIFAAKLVFMVAGYALYIGLGRLLTVESFGVYGVLFGVVSLINMVVINGTLQTVSRFVAAAPERANGIRRRAFAFQLVFAGVLLAAYVAAAPAIAEFFHDASLVPLLRSSALITGVYAFYAINVGYLNGLQQFARQASLDMLFSTLKVALILAFVALGLGLQGTVLGFAAAAACVLAVSFRHAGLSLAGPPANVTLRELATYGVSTVAGALLLNGVLNADLFVLKHAALGDDANTLAGHYTAAQSIARIPYSLMITVTLVLFPVIASLSKHDEATQRRRAETTSRALSMIITLLAGMVAVVAPISTDVVLVLYPAGFADAGAVLSLLVAGTCLLTLLNVATTIISGAGRPAVSAAILTLTLAVQVATALWWVPTESARGAAMATTVAGAVGCLAALGFLGRAYGTRVPPWSVAVTVAATAPIVALGAAFHGFLESPSRVVTVLYCAVAYGLYLALCAIGGVLLGASPTRDRVLWVTKPLDPPFNDGAKVLPRTLLEHMDPSSIAICVSRAAPPGQWPEGLTTVRVYSSSKSFVGRVLQNARMLGYLVVARFQYRALHFFFAPNPTTCAAIRALKWISPGVTFVQTIMSRPRTFEGSAKLLFGDVVIAQSEATRDELAARSGRTDIVLLRPGLAAPGEAPTTTKPRSELGPTLLFAGDIDHGGALPHLAAVVPALLRRHPTLRFLFSVRVKGPQTIERAQAFFDEHLATFASRAEMLVDHPDFDELLAAQDAMIFPAEDLYTKVDAPLVVLETLARGKPVFLLDRAPLSEIPGPALASALVARDDAELVDKLDAFFARPESIAPETLRAVVAERFSAEHSASALARIYAR